MERDHNCTYLSRIAILTSHLPIKRQALLTHVVAGLDPVVSRSNGLSANSVRFLFLAYLRVAMKIDLLGLEYIT